MHPDGLRIGRTKIGLMDKRLQKNRAVLNILLIVLFMMHFDALIK